MSIAISVLMPVYNGAFFLEETLNSLVSQTFNNFEVICINDGSTDNSLEILNSYSQKYKFIKVYNKPNEGTAAKAVNFGLKYATGEFFMYTSQDDLYSEKLLETNYFEAKALNADAVVPNTIFYFSNTDNKLGYFGLNNNYPILSGNEAFSLSLNWRISGFVLWRRSLLANFGDKFFNFAINSDEFTTRLLYFHSEKVIFTKENFYYRQNNPNSITKKWNHKLLESFITVRKLEEFIQENSLNKKEDLLRVWETLYYEIIRITSILHKNKDNMDISEYNHFDSQLKKIYTDNLYKTRQVKLKNTKQNIKKVVMLISYSTLRKFHLLEKIIRK